MSVITVASAVVSIIGQIARHPALADTKVATYAEIIGNLTDTASSLIARGEEGVAALVEFRAELKQLRSDLAAGSVSSEQLVNRIKSMRARSDTAHGKLQALKPAAPAPAPKAPAVDPATAVVTARTAPVGAVVVDEGGGQRRVTT